MIDPQPEDRAAREGELFRLLVENVVDYAIFVVDPGGLVQTWSHGAERLLGYSEEEILGRSADVFFTPDDLQKDVPRKEMRLAEEFGRGDDDRWHVRKNGTKIWVSGVMTPLKDERGMLRGFAKIMRDRTDWFLAHQASLETEDRYRTILESITDAFFTVDRDWRFTYLNRQAQRLIDPDLEGMVGKNLWDAYPGLLGSEFEHAYRRVVAERVPTSATAYYPDHHRWYEVRAYPCEDGMSVYFRDVTEQRLQEAVHSRPVTATDPQKRVYETALSSTPDFNYIFDLEGRFTFVNAALLDLWQKRLDEALGKTFFELGYPTELAEKLHREIDQVIETKIPVRADTPFTSHLGTRYYEYIFVPVIGSRGTVEAVAGSTRDITERKQAEENLRLSEERLKLIVESATDYAIFTMDLNGKVDSWNTGASNLLGYEEAEILGRSADIFYTPEDIAQGIPAREIDRAIERGRAENERWHRRKDGTLFWASGLLMPMKEGSKIVGLLKIMRDTTEQKRTEQELEVSRERLDLVVNSSEVGLWYCDLPFATLVWNPKCKEHFGLPPDAEVTIETFYERIHPDDREGTRQAIERSIGTHSEYDAEFRTVDPASPVRWVRAIGQPFYGVDGVPMRFDGITVDVTQRIEQEEALREADRRKDEFLATLAHELRNPLAPIRNALLLMRGIENEDTGFEAERAMAQRQVVHLARLIDDLMDVARISRGRIELHKEEVDLGTIITHAVETARPQIDDRHHELTLSLPEAPIRLEADPTRLEQVLWNLLNNSAKYTAPGGHISLSAEVEGGDVVLRVKDDGIGISPEMLPRVFEMFVQAREHTGHSQGGLGIGLSLVRTLVEMHGGSITARSEGPDRGSEFEIRLPSLVTTHERGASPASPATAKRDDPRGRRILVVDDNTDAAASLARLLERLYRQSVRVANDGPEALSVASEFLPEVILLDIGLPGMDGNEVARRLRSQPEFESSLIVALTGWGQEGDRKRSRESGIDYHLVKPVDPDVLMSLIEHGRVPPT